MRRRFPNANIFETGGEDLTADEGSKTLTKNRGATNAPIFLASSGSVFSYGLASSEGAWRAPGSKGEARPSGGTGGAEGYAEAPPTEPGPLVPGAAEARRDLV